MKQGQLFDSETFRRPLAGLELTHLRVYILYICLLSGFVEPHNFVNVLIDILQ